MIPHREVKFVVELEDGVTCLRLVAFAFRVEDVLDVFFDVVGCFFEGV